ncbi:transcription factor NIGT1 [Aegilops tauschii subsp. strangulata]|uniref:HTH myb-type domain-containing protein n=2 Tax=Aegilops tauschii TaxID=37682 RepID=A0A453AR00_AEGTS|nr:transcription factor NIGT1 [Aegilops tauschii subsp. strangulata]XP_044327730.1 transcription factor NIGT1-like [Triticum aestivum]
MEMEMEVPPAQADCDGARRRLQDYLLALEEERRKIHVFQRELPLCLDLVTQTIEGMKSQMGGAASEETVSDHGGPVLEEFIPLKPSLSLSSSDDETSNHHAAAPVSNAKAETPPPTPETKKAMPDWLQSAQLSTWSEPQQSSSLQKVLPCRPVALNATRTGGAFHPFEKEKQPEPELPASSTTAPASSALVGDSGDKATSDTEVHDKDSKDVTEKDTDKDKEGHSQPNRKPRRCWAPELHRRFLQALQQLGGSHVATPKQIRELMKVDGLTNDEVKSHLQKYRLHTSRRPSSTAQSGATAATQPAPQFFVVGSCIWVPQQEYAAAAAAAAAAADATNVAPGSANQVYARTATLPSGLKPHLEKQSSRQSEGPRSGDTGGVNSDTDNPAMSSSSSQTTSAGHP